MAKKRKKRIVLRYRKNDHSHNLLVAANRWIKANGGNAVVLGGIGLETDGSFRYRVSIGAVGKPPVKKELRDE